MDSVVIMFVFPYVQLCSYKTMRDFPPSCCHSGWSHVPAKPDLNPHIGKCFIYLFIF